MKIKELIDILKEYPENIEVGIRNSDCIHTVMRVQVDNIKLIKLLDGTPLIFIE